MNKISLKIPDNPKWNTLRWVLFFPIATIIYLLLSGIGIHLILFIATQIFFNEKRICMAISFGLLSFFASYFFVSISVKIIPLHKKRISIILLLMPAAFNFYIVETGRQLYYAHPFFMYDFYYHYQVIPIFIGSIVGGIISFFMITKRNS